MVTLEWGKPLALNSEVAFWLLRLFGDFTSYSYNQGFLKHHLRVADVPKWLVEDDGSSVEVNISPADILALAGKIALSLRFCKFCMIGARPENLRTRKRLDARLLRPRIKKKFWFLTGSSIGQFGF
jgi:hypothetical protein